VWDARLFVSAVDDCASEFVEGVAEPSRGGGVGEGSITSVSWVTCGTDREAMASR
jgi:hypothetical protein